MILIADYGNWLSEDIGKILAAAGIQHQLINNVGRDLRFRMIRGTLRPIVNDKHFYSLLRLVEFFLFDLIMLRHVVKPRNRSLIFFKNQVFFTLLVARWLNKPTILVFGSEPVVTNRISKFTAKWLWKYVERVELQLAELVICESNYIADKLERKNHLIINCFSNILLTKNDVKIVASHAFKAAQGKGISNCKKRMIGFIYGETKGFELVKDVVKRSNKYNHTYYIVNAPVYLNPPFKNIRRMDHHGFISFLRDLDIFLLPTESDAGPRALIESITEGCIAVTSKYCMGPDFTEFGFVRVVERTTDAFSVALDEYKYMPIYSDYLKFYNNFSVQQLKLISTLNTTCTSVKEED